MATVAINPTAGSTGAETIKRRYGTASIAVNSALGSCDILDARDYSELAIQPPAGVTAVAVYAAESATGTFVLVDNIGTNGSVTLPASKWTTLDTTKIGPFGYLKFVSTGANGTAIVAGKT